MQKKIEFFLFLLIITLIFYISYSYLDYKFTLYKKEIAYFEAQKLHQLLLAYQQKEDKIPYSFSELIPRYIKVTPLDPWHHPYILEIEKGIIISKGPDGKGATYDDIIVKTLSLFYLKGIKIIKKRKSAYLEKGDIVRLIFSQKVSSYGKNPDADFLFYDQKGYPLNQDPNKKPFSFGKNSYYTFFEGDDKIIDLVIKNDTNILLNQMRINLKYIPQKRGGNYFKNSYRHTAQPAPFPILLLY